MHYFEENWLARRHPTKFSRARGDDRIGNAVPWRHALPCVDRSIAERGECPITAMVEAELEEKERGEKARMEAQAVREESARGRKGDGAGKRRPTRGDHTGRTAASRGSGTGERGGEGGRGDLLRGLAATCV